MDRVRLIDTCTFYQIIAWSNYWGKTLFLEVISKRFGISSYEELGVCTEEQAEEIFIYVSNYQLMPYMQRKRYWDSMKYRKKA